MHQLFKTEQAMMTFAKQLANFCHPPCVIFLSGGLGVGKTTFSRGFIQGKGYTGKVKSPTYTLVEPYCFADYKIFHFDFYRIHDPEELESMGIRDYFYENSLSLIEWPEQAGEILPIPDIACYFTLVETDRKIEIITKTQKGKEIIAKLI